jgi:hypothetical protein
VFSIPNITVEMEIKLFNHKIIPTLGNHCGATTNQQQQARKPPHGNNSNRMLESHVSIESHANINTGHDQDLHPW